VIKYRVEIDETRTVRWYKWGTNKRHRENDSAVEYIDGGKVWWFNGKRHRKNGPAVEYASGRKEWVINGKLHREDGPAIEKANGDKEWWFDGKKLTKKQWKAKVNS